MRTVICIITIASLLSGCKRAGESGPRSPERRTLALGEVSGISGLAIAPDGALWMVPERHRVVIELSRSGEVKRWPVDGVPRGFDLESIALLGDGRIAFGGESNKGAPAGSALGPTTPVMIATREGDRMIIAETMPIDLTAWRMAVRENQGVEGLCLAGRFLVAGIETTGDDGGQRFAPLAVYDFSAKRWQAYRLALSSPTGNLSGLACRMRDGAVELFATERHFGVLRVLRARLPAAPGAVTVELVADLDGWVGDTELNVEGIEVVGDDLVLATDNQYRGIEGDNELITLPGRGR